MFGPCRTDPSRFDNQMFFKSIGFRCTHISRNHSGKPKSCANLRAQKFVLQHFHEMTRRALACRVTPERLHFLERMPVMVMRGFGWFSFIFSKLAQSFRQPVFFPSQSGFETLIDQEIRACDQQGKPKSCANLRAWKCCFPIIS